MCIVGVIVCDIFYFRSLRRWWPFYPLVLNVVEFSNIVCLRNSRERAKHYKKLFINIQISVASIVLYTTTSSVLHEHEQFPSLPTRHPNRSLPSK
jgi:hypothetical protein